MRLPFPSQGRKPSSPTVKLKSGSSHSTRSPVPDVVSTAFLALKESADAFPPLKSAVSGVLVVRDIAQRAKSSKSDARDIARRTEEILNVIADAVPDPSIIPMPMLQSIERFTVLLDEISRSMEAIALSGSVSRLVHLNRNEHVLRNIKARLDDAYRDFLAAAILRAEIEQTQTRIVVQQTQAQLSVLGTELAGQQAQTHNCVVKLSSVTNTVVCYSCMAIFLASP
ncbi:hypothetical protein MVEN_01760800 [Mycena venus]|uniref:Uncharacterized protein n=1 Tax=Mycena venus TaxID=2733690 RepID=A0A8H7CPB0_9AGAR|nr:hypothetical protein MVEN_01760800 [Mycena venus]